MHFFLDRERAWKLFVRVSAAITKEVPAAVYPPALPALSYWGAGSSNVRKVVSSSVEHYGI